MVLHQKPGGGAPPSVPFMPPWLEPNPVTPIVHDDEDESVPSVLIHAIVPERPTCFSRPIG